MGWALDEMSQQNTYRFIDHMPFLFQFFKKYPKLESVITLGLSQNPGILAIPRKEDIKNVFTSGCSVYLYTKEGSLFVLGENYHGQLGIKGRKYIENLEKVEVPSIEDVNVGRRFAIIKTCYLNSTRILWHGLVSRDADSREN